MATYEYTTEIGNTITLVSGDTLSFGARSAAKVSFLQVGTDVAVQYYGIIGVETVYLLGATLSALDATQFTQCMAKFDKHFHLSPTDLKSIFEIIDLNKDSLVDWKEFVGIGVHVLLHSENDVSRSTLRDVAELSELMHKKLSNGAIREAFGRNLCEAPNPTLIHPNPNPDRDPNWRLGKHL